MSACQDLWTPNERQWRSCHPSGHEGGARDRATASTNKLSCTQEPTPHCRTASFLTLLGNDPALQGVFDEGDKSCLVGENRSFSVENKRLSEIILEVKEITTKDQSF